MRERIQPGADQAEEESTGKHMDVAPAEIVAQKRLATCREQPHEPLP